MSMDINVKVKNYNCSLSGISIQFNVNSRILKKEFKNGNISEIAEIYYNGNNLGQIMESLKNSSGENDVKELYRNERLIIVKLQGIECPMLGVLKKYAITPLSTKEEKIEEGKNTWFLSVDNMDMINELSQRLRAITGSDVSVNIYRKTKVDRKSLFIVKEAYDLGFFDVPKRINLMELSAVLNIPPTTLDLSIRKSLKYFLEDNLTGNKKLEYNQ